jgi:hypothetical protein
MCTKEDYPFQTSSYFVRKDIIFKYMEETPDFLKAADVGDVPLMLYCATKGNFYYINDIYSCYRIGHGGGWSENLNNKEFAQKHIELIRNMYVKFDKYTDNIYHEYIENAILMLDVRFYNKFRDYEFLDNPKYKSVIKNMRLRDRINLVIKKYFPIVVILFDNWKNSRK